MGGPLAHATRTEWDKVLGLRRPHILGPKVAGVNVLVAAFKWTVRMKKRGLALATPNEKGKRPVVTPYTEWV
jgi:hypothetical protein